MTRLATPRPADVAQGATFEKRQAVAVRAWLRNEADADERRALAAHREQVLALTGDSTDLAHDEYDDLDDADTLTVVLRPQPYRAALSVQGGAAGGYTIPQTFSDAIEQAMNSSTSPVRDSAEIVRTETGADLKWPTCDDTANEGVQLAENQAASDLDASFGAITLRAYRYSSKVVKLPAEYLDDAPEVFFPFLGRLLGERVSRAANRGLTVGNGNSQPAGIASKASVGVTAAGQTAMLPDEILALIGSVDAVYRVGPAVGFMCHPNTALTISQMKDGGGRYIFDPSQRYIAGYPVIANTHMPVIAAGARALLFGMLSKYIVREVRAVRLRRLDERYADSDQVAFDAILRCDGAILDAGTKPVRVLQMAP